MSSFLNTYNNFFKTDEQVDDAIKYIRDGVIPDKVTNAHLLQKYDEKLENVKVRNNNLFISYLGRDLQVVKPRERENIIKEFYGNMNKSLGLGVKGIYAKISNEYIGITLRDVEEALMGIQDYQLSRPLKPVTNKPTVATYPFQFVYVDHIDLTKYADSNRGYKYILNIIDAFSRYAWRFPQKRMDTTEYLRALRKVLQETGLKIKVLRSDNGGAFTGQEAKDFYRQNNISHGLGISWNPKSQSYVESNNARLRQAIRDLFVRTGRENWVDHIKAMTDAYNESKHSQTGYEPALLLFTGDIEEAEEDKQAVIEKMQEKARKKVEQNQTLELEEGDNVRVSLRKLDNKVREAIKKGEFKDVAQRWSSEVYVVSKVVKTQKYYQGLEREYYHVNHLNGSPLVSNSQPMKLFASDLLLTKEVSPSKPIKVSKPVVVEKRVTRSMTKEKQQEKEKQKEVTEPVRRSGRERKGKVFEDFVTKLDLRKK